MNLNYKQAAQWLSIGESSLRKLVAEGRIYPIRINRRVLFTEDILKAFNEKCAAGKPVRRASSAGGSRRSVNL